MTWLKFFFEPNGRIGRRAFTFGLIGVYAVWSFIPVGLAAGLWRNMPVNDGALFPVLLLLPLLLALHFVVLPYAYASPPGAHRSA